jgi:WD40 repeat protein
MKRRGWWVIVMVIVVMLGGGPVVRAQEPTPLPGVPDDLVPITAENADRLTLLRVMSDPERTGYVDRLAFSTDGDWLFSEQVLNEILMWSVETGELWLELQAKSGDAPSSLIVNPVNDSVAYNVGQDIFIWDGEHHREAAVRDCKTLAFSPDGSLLACQSTQDADDSYIQIWDADALTYEKTLSVGPRYPDVAFTPDGSQIVLPIIVRDANTEQVNRAITVWTIDSDTEAVVFPLFEVRDSGGFGVRSMALSPDGQMVAYTASNYGRVGSDEINVLAVRNLATGAYWAEVTPLAEKVIGSVTFSTDGTAVIVADGDGRIRVVAAESGAEITRKSSDGEIVFRVALNGAGTLLAAGTQSGLIELWGVRE